MSFEAQTLASYAVVGSPTKKLVLLILANFADRDGLGVRPSVRRIHIMTELSPRTIKSHLSELRDDKYLIVVRPATPRSPTEYRLNFDLLIENIRQRPSDEVPTWLRKMFLSSAVETIIETGGESPAPLGVNLLHPWGESPAPESLIKPESTPRADKAKTALSAAGFLGDEIKNQSAFEAVQKFVARSNEAGNYDLGRWPEEIRDWVTAVCRLWGLVPPDVPKRGGGDFAFWIRSIRELKSACGEFRGKTVLGRVHKRYIKEWQKTGSPPFQVSSPRSLVNPARAAAAELRQIKLKGNPSQMMIELE